MARISTVHRLIAFLPILLGAMVGCSTMESIRPSAKVEIISGPFKRGDIISMETGKTLSFDRFIEELKTKRLVFIGETHDNPEHHLIQVQILQALMAGSECPLTLAMEFFQTTQQEVLDRYLEGELNETMFLKKVGWHRAWGFHYHFYRPLIVMGKQGGSKILAVNAPRFITRKVARSGLSSLKPEERSQLATDIDLTNESHRAYVREVYSKHPHRAGLISFDFFYQAQCVWEDTMAENIGTYLAENDQKMVVFTGNGHIIKKFGIPDRTLRHVRVDPSTVVLFPLTGPLKIEKDTADYIWLTGGPCGRPPPSHPKIGMVQDGTV